MTEGRITFLNLGAVSPPHLFEAARALNGPTEPRGPALIVAQAAVEVGVERLIDFALQVREVYDPLREWVVDESITSWSPANTRVLALWTALTGDTLTANRWWTAYDEGRQLRNVFAHRLVGVSQEQAKSFVTAAEQLMGHMVTVVAAQPPQSPS